MLIELTGTLSFEEKTEADNNSEKVQECETLMWKYQQPISEAINGEKWMLMNKIFDLKEYRL